MAQGLVKTAENSHAHPTHLSHPILLPTTPFLKGQTDKTKQIKFSCHPEEGVGFRQGREGNFLRFLLPEVRKTRNVC